MADPNPNVQSPEQARQQAEAAAKARADAQAAAIKKLDESDKARAESNMEVEKRRAQGKPTPTPREIDLAKLGLFNPDDREDDGSGPEVMPAHIRRAAIADEDAVAKYKTRELKTDKPKVI